MFFFYRYIYTDTIIIDSMNIKGLIYGSEKYMIKNLRAKCDKFLTSNVNTKHVCVVFQTAHDFHMDDLQIKAMDLILEKGRQCLESDDFLQLSAECLKLIVESNNLNCDEGIIYQRMVRWAKQRCGEKKIPTTDESIRNSLGNLLHLIRFPCMEPKFFTEEVSSTNILTFKERVSVYEHFNYKQTTIFLSKRRLGDTIRVVRCKEDIDDKAWSKTIRNDCVHFITSNNAELVSVLLFRPKNYYGSNHVTITILYGCSVLRKIQTTIYSIKNQEIRDISLQFPVKVLANTQYTVQLNWKGPATFRGKDFITKVTTKCRKHSDFVVTFLPNTEKNTQIPGLIFEI